MVTICLERKNEDLILLLDLVVIIGCDVTIKLMQEEELFKI